MSKKATLVLDVWMRGNQRQDERISFRSNTDMYVPQLLQYPSVRGKKFSKERKKCWRQTDGQSHFFLLRNALGRHLTFLLFNLSKNNIGVTIAYKLVQAVI